jgi:hypothetical protein
MLTDSLGSFVAASEGRFRWETEAERFGCVNSCTCMLVHDSDGLNDRCQW